MKSLFKKRMPGEKGFKASIRLLEISHLSLLKAEKKELLRYITPYFYKKVCKAIRRAGSYLYKLKSSPDTETILDYLQTFHLLQRDLCHFHLINDKDTGWYDRGVAMHQILDTYHHIFQKFMYTDKCRWCGFDLNSSWSVLITDALVKKHTAAYLGMSYSTEQLSQVAKVVLFDYPLSCIKIAKSKSPPAKSASLALGLDT
jgi:hypothetical protein